MVGAEAGDVEPKVMTMIKQRVLLVASENDQLPNCKVGGIGDVVRDVPPALAALGWDILVVTPSYGFLHEVPGSQFIGTIEFPFAGRPTEAALYSVPGKQSHPGVQHLVIHHPGFLWVERGRPQIYRTDPPETPFASDASKFALFCAAVAEGIVRDAFQTLTCIHLHDWHAAFLLILRKYRAGYGALQGIRTAYTIHNLALQGVRPFDGHWSSMSSWYPDVTPVPDLADPRWPNCLNPMAVGIRLADAVHTVSPSYATEILKPSHAPRYYGGEGLEADLAKARENGRVFGILNGCEYPADRVSRRLPFVELVELLRSEQLAWIGARESVSAAHLIALERLNELRSRSLALEIVATSVSRVVDQKMFLLSAPGSDGRPGLLSLLDIIGARGIYLLLGSGDKRYEDFLVAPCANNP